VAGLFWRAVTAAGYAELWGPVYAALLCWPGGGPRLLGLQLLAAEVCGLAVLVPLRYLFRRERPVVKKPGPIPIPWERFSFPSSHAIRSQCAAVVLAINYPILWPVAVPAAVLVAWSRVILRRHFPSDVVTGVVIGALCGLAGGQLGLWFLGA
jgi:undecaprenyl-diphosphatase